MNQPFEQYMVNTECETCLCVQRPLPMLLLEAPLECRRDLAGKVDLLHTCMLHAGTTVVTDGPTDKQTTVTLMLMCRALISIGECKFLKEG